jgi:PPK2 family polyphosphate:nucleotide phosphotransferase
MKIIKRGTSRIQTPMKISSPYLVKPGKKVNLGKFSTNTTDGIKDKPAAEMLIAKHTEQLSDLQQRFYASQSKALLIVLQGMDTAGKDGVIRHIFSGINPQGCNVSSFKVPTPEEARHDFLWRIQAQTPARGMIGIFNRSHYEDVLSPYVHGAIDKKVVKQRLLDINKWEQTLADNNVIVLKFFLHVSQAEQTARLQARIDDPDKHWKLSAADLVERQYWNKYTDAYEHLLSHTSCDDAPWFVIPADHKWYRNAAVSTILIEAMKSLKLDYPEPTFNPEGIDLDKLSEKAAAAKAVEKQAATTAKKKK